MLCLISLAAFLKKIKRGVFVGMKLVLAVVLVLISLLGGQSYVSSGLLFLVYLSCF